MESEAIDVVAHSEEINRLLVRYELQVGTVELVENIQSWCRDHGEEESNPFRAGKTFHGPPPHILLAKVITPVMVAAVTGGMLVRPGLRSFFQKTLELSGDGIRFLRHLVLHEIGHATGIRDEDECDAWAFGELAKLESEWFLT